MSLTDLTQNQRSELQTIPIIYLLDWVIGSTTLHISSRDYRYKYGSLEILYESYLMDIQGLGEIVSFDGNPTNSDVTIKVKNDPWSTYSYLSQLNDVEPFQRTQITISEIRPLDQWLTENIRLFTKDYGIVDPLVTVDSGMDVHTEYSDDISRTWLSREVFSSDVRTTRYVGVVEQFGPDINEQQFTLRLSSRLFDCRNNWGLTKVKRSSFPYHAPEESARYHNIAYGDLAGVPCRCLKTGAVDLLSSDLSSTSTSFSVQGLRRFEFESSGYIQIGDEIFSYTDFSGDTFSGCDRSAGEPHDEDSPVTQVLSEYVYEIAQHPVKSISRVSIDDYDNTSSSSIVSYTGQDGDELAGYEGRAVVQITTQLKNSKQFNKQKDSHTHTTSSTGTRWDTKYEELEYTRDWSFDTHDHLISGDKITFGSLTDWDERDEDPAIYDKATIHMLLSLDSDLIGEARFRYYDRFLTYTLGENGNQKFLVFPAGQSSFEATWFHIPLKKLIKWRSGYVSLALDSYSDLNKLTLYECYMTYTTPEGGSMVSVTGGASDEENIIDGDDETYGTITEASTGTRLVTLTPYQAENKSFVEQVDFYVDFDSYGSPTSWDVVVEYLAAGEEKTIVTYPAGQTYERALRKTTFLSDPSLPGVDNWILNTDGNMRIKLTNGSGSTTIRIYDAYFECIYASEIDPYSESKALTAQSIRNGVHTAQLVVGDEVTVDFEGYQDDSSGTYTGTAYALIERPDHVLKHFLVYLCSQSSSSIGDTFDESGLIYASSAVDYAFAFLAGDISKDAQRLCYELARQCRSMFYEWGGKYELRYITDGTPTEDFEIETDDIHGKLPNFSYPSTFEIANKITVFYNKDYKTKKRTDSEFYRKLDVDSASKGFLSDPLVGSYGQEDIEEEVTLTAVRTQSMAQHLLDFILSRKKLPVLSCSMSVNWRANQVDPSQCFRYNCSLMGDNVYRIKSYRLTPNKNTIDIEGEKA